MPEIYGSVEQWLPNFIRSMMHVKTNLLGSTAESSSLVRLGKTRRMCQVDADPDNNPVNYWCRAFIFIATTAML